MTLEKDPLFQIELPNYSFDELLVMLQRISEEIYEGRFSAEPHLRVKIKEDNKHNKERK